MKVEILDLPKEDLTKTELKQIKKALTFCKENLSWSLRGNGTSDYEHSLRVVNILISELKVRECLPIILAILHDVAERSPALIIDIETLFGSEIAGLAQQLVRDNSHKNKPLQVEAIMKIRQNYRFNSAPYVVRIVKCADKIDNLRDLDQIPKNLKLHKNIPYWIVEAKTSILPLAEKTNKQAFRIIRKQINTYEPLFPLPT